ncbi:MAG TPA: class I SAM-dependent methyltransferase, partial [Pseudonocardia sp.]|nr:class I SAM-dependent methyltransferase [Pseudonocardia sp.]
MRLGLIPANPVEWLVDRLNLVPRPLLDTQMAFTMARIVMVASKIGLFDALAAGRATVEQIAERCDTDVDGTGKLLPTLVSSGYLRARGETFELTAMSRKWLLSTSPHSLADKLLFQFSEWDWMGRAEEFVRTGKQEDFHATLDSREWQLYQRGMRSVASAATDSLVKAIPIPPGATRLLDIGGSHGLYSAALCRRNPNLSAVVLDLEGAVEHAAPLLAAEGLGERLRHQVGNALTDDLGTETYDAVITVGVVHHFTDEQNRTLATKVARALRPGGTYTIADFFRLPHASQAQQLPSLMDFYFALTSESGTWPAS